MKMIKFKLKDETIEQNIDCNIVMNIIKGKKTTNKVRLKLLTFFFQDEFTKNRFLVSQTVNPIFVAFAACSCGSFSFAG